MNVLGMYSDFGLFSTVLHRTSYYVFKYWSTHTTRNIFHSKHHTKRSDLTPQFHLLDPTIVDKHRNCYVQWLRGTWEYTKRHLVKDDRSNWRHVVTEWEYSVVLTKSTSLSNTSKGNRGWLKVGQSVKWHQGWLHSGQMVWHDLEWKVHVINIHNYLIRGNLVGIPLIKHGIDKHTKSVLINIQNYLHCSRPIRGKV